ncbi:MaoC family dehydratase N-terminal domain-containing protein [Halioxenophilus sp. WMMB6]|uniref:FAS1-like dehydratase domain-containing protein n=1 Tax=Halioxenophilus sp. WMMB6 TaxID=3073815 RepID=UPI00295EA7EA|nr:MaoC family dehydratase N-terminal domain-containing protein [Halioxenophilus sp. WMMB6]
MSDKTLDCSDLENYMGKPIAPARMKEPLHVNDIRRWAQAMHYPNLLHYDTDFAAEGRFGKIVAPQSFAVAADDGHGAGPACVGRIPESHLIFGGDEWWFYGPKIFGGDEIVNEKIPFDFAVKETKFAGPTCFQRGDNNYYNQNGDFIAKQRSTAIRYRADLALEMGSMAGAEEDPVWTDDELKALEDKKYEFIKMMHDLGHGKRYWDDITVGDELPVRVIGPHSVASFTTEWRAYLFTIWGGTHRPGMDLEALGFTKEMAGHENDPVMERDNPEWTDGAYFGPSRGHLFPKYARMIGMPRGYGYGASMGAWILDYLGGWAGEWGQVVHCNSAYRGPAFTGDATYMTAKVIDKMVDEEGRNVIQVDVKMANQLGATMATAKAEIELPTK